MSTLALTNTLAAGAVENINHVQQDFTDIRTWANGNIDDTNFLSTSGMYTAYRTIVRQSALFGLANTAGTYPIPVAPSSADQWNKTGVAIGSTGSAAEVPLCFYLDDADHTITGRTIKLRLRAQVSTNATAPAITFTFGLYPVTFAGAADNLAVTLGAVIVGSTVAHASPGASGTVQGNSGDFTFPADGQYALGVVTSGTIANNSAALLSVQLQQRWS